MHAVVLDVLDEHGPEVAASEDEHPVEALTPKAAYHALADCVRSGCRDRGSDDPDAVAVDDRVEGSGELGVTAADEEIDSAGG